jgi:hypothetical protein
VHKPPFRSDWTCVTTSIHAYNDKQLLSDSSLSNPHWLTTDYAETLQTLGVSLYGTYEFRKAITEGEEPKPVRWIPYAELGAGYGLLLKADAQLTQTVTPGVGSLDKDTQEALFTYSTKAYRQMPYVTPSVGLGLRLETKHSDFWLALRFRPMTWNVVRFKDPNDRSLEPLRQGYYRMDDDLGLNQFALTIGYAYVFGKQP